MAEVTIYTTRYCPYCRAATALLNEKSVPFTEIDVTGDDAARSELRTRTGRRTVPQVFIGEQSIGGYDDLAALDRSGRLDELLRAG
jgi:glutaredoxin 3